MEYLWEDSVIFMGTQDMDSTHEFYSKNLGFSSYEENGESKIYNMPGGCKLAFSSKIKMQRDFKNPIISLTTPYVDSLYTKFKQEGVCIKNKPKYNSSSRKYYFHMIDPNGYIIEIQKKKSKI
ncbi:VOC family protein [Clostridiaceae bacterium M8S5]|nr:VOC family protein [Clostridiaceae bacterium M8S5]